MQGDVVPPGPSKVIGSQSPGLDSTLQPTGSLEASDMPPPDSEATKKFTDEYVVLPGHRAKSKIIWAVIILVLLVLGGASLFLVFRGGNTASIEAGRFDSVTLPLGEIKDQDDASKSASELQVNGQLKVSEALTLSPGSQPLQPKAGQVYFDKTSKLLLMYDGQKFTSLGSSLTTYSTTNVTNLTNLTNFTNLTNSVTNITNILGAIGNPLQVQPDTPGIQQVGNFNISGTGMVGLLQTTAIASPSALNVSTGNAVGASGGITIKTGDSSTTASGNLTLDTGAAIISGVEVGGKDFETGTEGIIPCFGFADTATQSSIVQQNGSYTLRWAAGGSPTACLNDAEPYQTVPVVPGHSYAFSLWVRAGTNPATIRAQAQFSSNGFGGASLLAQTEWGTATDTTTGWTNVTGVLVAPAGANYVGLRLFSSNIVASGDVHYIDNYTVTDLSSSTAVAALNLGATNAQQVTLGNSSQIAPTSIYGGGINLNAGLGNFNIAGGALSQTTSGATYTTTSGALDITAAASSIWKVANGTGAGGTLTVQAGGGGGNGAGGELKLRAGVGSGAGAGGGISIISGDSSSTASGNITIDSGNGIINGTVIGTKGFEGGSDNMTPWFGSTVAQSSAMARTGNGSLAVSITNSFWGTIENLPGTPVAPGHQIYYSFWVRAGTSTSTIGTSIAYVGSSATSSLNSVTDSATGWTQVSGTAVAPAGATSAYFRIQSNTGAVGTVHYFDDFEVIDLSSSSAFSAIDIGTTNAKAVTIGNANQISATTIRGSGINLQAGQGSIALTGGVFSLTGSAASALTTSAGALTITSATSATWGIATSTTGNGEDLRITAGNGMGVGVSNGGDLYLQGGLANGGGIGGSVIVRSKTDATDAFQIQTSASAALFVADTSNLTITIGGSAGAFAKLALANAHFTSTQTVAPTIDVPAACGTGSTAAVTAGSTDVAGSFTITAGATGTPSTCDTTITFNQPYTTAPKSIIVVGKADAASAAQQIYVASTTTTNFTVSFGNTSGGVNGTTYSFSYWVVE